MPRVIDEFGRVYNVPIHILRSAGGSRPHASPQGRSIVELHIHIHIQGDQIALGNVSRHVSIGCGDVSLGCADIALGCDDLAIGCGDMRSAATRRSLTQSRRKRAATRRR